ncbi:MAG: IS1634 family transposase, partial [Actinophytocola sp.]|nr:IS1634 family transposase [Actinophytocola sp.]
MLDLGVEPTPAVADLVPPDTEAALFEHPNHGRRGGRDGAGRVVATGSCLLFDALAGVYAGLGFDVLGDETFRDLV